MKRIDCPPKLNRPRLHQPALKPTRTDEKLAGELVRELARIVVEAGDETRPRDRRCAISARAGDRLERMDERSRRAVLATASKLAAEGSSDGPGLSEKLTKRVRAMAESRFREERRHLSKVIREVTEQARGRSFSHIRTYVRMRPASGEIIVPAYRYMCIDKLERLTFEWETTEPDAARVYWELRGPVQNGQPGKFLGRGFSPNTRNDGTIGGAFTLSLADYLPAQTPDPTQRYVVRVLPLADPDSGIRFGRHQGHSLTVLATTEPEPPTGVGPWSPPAEIDYGAECRQPGTIFDIDEVTYYQNVAIKVNWFKVDTDQPGPGDEEYSLRAFVVDYTPQSATMIGSFGGFLPIEEGDTSRHPLGWATWNHQLSSPLTNLWPRSFMVVLSVLEQDGGDEFQDWHDMMSELAQEALEGDIADAISDALQDIRDEVAEATEEMRDDIRKELIAYIGALIGASALNAAAAVVAFAVALIQIFARAGMTDDYFGVQTVTFNLTNNDEDWIRDGSGWSVQGNLSSAPHSGTEQAGKFTTDEVEVQLISRESPDAAGLSGIVSFGLEMQLSNKKTIYR